VQYACGVEAKVIGKPSKAFFLAALASMNVDPQNVRIVSFGRWLPQFSPPLFRTTASVSSLTPFHHLCVHSLFQPSFHTAFDPVHIILNFRMTELSKYAFPDYQTGFSSDSFLLCE